MITNIAHAVNEIPIMQTLVGEYRDSWLGEKLLTIDFNADRDDDPLVCTIKSGFNEKNPSDSVLRRD